MINFLDKEKSDTIFLATDNFHVLNFFKNRYKNLVWLDKSIDSMPYHYKKDPKKGLSTLIDLYLLASCDTLIFSRTSTFAQAASVIAPDNAKLIDVDIGKKEDIELCIKNSRVKKENELK